MEMIVADAFLAAALLCAVALGFVLSHCTILWTARMLTGDAPERAPRRRRREDETA